MKPVRAFVAIPLPKAAIAWLVDLQGQLRKTGLRASWSKPETMHLTIRFLGDVAPSRLDTLMDTLRVGYTACSPVHLALGGADAFPNRRRPSVIFAGIEVLAGDLTSLRRIADDAAAEAGIPRDNQPFHPHVTLGRIRRDRPDAAALARFNAVLDSPRAHADAIDVSSVSLFSSTLRPGGPVHDEIATYPLARRKMETD